MMTAETLTLIIDEVLKRLKKKALLVLTDAGGYKKEIQQRLCHFHDLAFDVVIASDASSQHCQKRWAEVGSLRTIDNQLLNHLNSYQLILIPFLDVKTLGNLCHGIIDNDSTKLLSHTLMQNIPVKAFSYNCDPDSELNQLMGLSKNPAYNQLIRQNLAKAQQLGIDFCTMTQFESQCMTGKQVVKAIDDVIHENKFITLNDLLNKKVTRIEPGMKLTALAQDYLKIHPLG